MWSDHIRPRWDQISISKTSSTNHQKSSSMFLFIHVGSHAELLQDGRSMLALIQQETSSGLCCCLCPSNRSPWSRTRFFWLSPLVKSAKEPKDRNTGGEWMEKYHRNPKMGRWIQLPFWSIFINFLGNSTSGIPFYRGGHRWTHQRIISQGIPSMELINMHGKWENG